MIKKYCTFGFLLGAILVSGNCFAAESMSVLYRATDQGPGENIGMVIFSDTDEGLRVMYDLQGLTPGDHGFHVHENPDCSPVKKEGTMEHASAAGGHFDPEKTGKHLGPDGNGHRGDLPVLKVDQDGTAAGSIVFGKEKNLKADEFRNRSLMIHAGGDNYSDEPNPLGGGGARVACGIIQ